MWPIHQKGIIKRVRTRNTKKGRPPKVIRQGKAKLSFTGKAVTSNAGMALVSRAIDHFCVHDDLKKITADLDVSKQHQTSHLLEQLITLRMLGGNALSDIALLNDTAVEALFEWDHIAYPCTFGRRLGPNSNIAAFSRNKTSAFLNYTGTNQSREENSLCRLSRLDALEILA